MLFCPAYTSLKEQTTEVSQICASNFTLALFGFYLFLCNSHWGSLWGDAEVAGGRLLLIEFVLQSCQYRSWPTIRACWRQIFYTCGWQSWRFCSCTVKPTRVMIALELHQVSLAHLVIGEIMTSSGASSCLKAQSEALRGAAGAPLRDHGHLASLSLAVCFFLLPSHNWRPAANNTMWIWKPWSCTIRLAIMPPLGFWYFIV